MIKVWDYLPELVDEKADVMAAIERVLESGWLILGSEVEQFETEFSRFVECGWGTGVNSGTDALFIALKALGVGPGDEVVTVSNTAVPTVSAIVSSGATPRFVDIDADTYLMDVGRLREVVTERTRCILPVHLFGQCVDMDPLHAIAQDLGIHVVEDCAQAHGATYRGRAAGSLSDLSAFSFYPTKILGTYGDGGMICGRDDELREASRRLRKYGMERQYYAIEHGYNSRLDEIHAAILRTKLGRLPAYVARRREIAARYDEALAGSGLVLPHVADGNQHAYYLYVVRHPERDRIIEQLRSADIHLNISYPWPIHTMSGYSWLGYGEGDLPCTESAQREIFSLPMYPTLTDEQVDRVIEALRSIVA